MSLTGLLLYAWPTPLVHTVRAIKHVAHYFSHHAILGVPLDWILRFAFLAGLHLFLSMRMKVRRSLLICICILLAKESFDIIAVQSLQRPRLPEIDDAADLISGLSGIVLAESLRRMFGRRRSNRTSDPVPMH